MPSLTRRHFTTGLVASPLWWPQIAASPQPATILRLAGSPFGAPTLDPALARDLDTIFLMRQLYRGLLALSANLVPAPALANLESTGARSFTFRLRDDARFADGRAVTAEDVHRSLSRAIAPSTMIYLGDIVGAKAILAGSTHDLAGFDIFDDQLFSIRLEAPSMTFPARIAAVQASIVDSDDLANGTGPFIVERLDEDMLALAPNQAFANPPRHGVSIRIGQAATNAQNLLQSGDIDLATIDGNTAALLADPASDLELEIVRTPLLATYYIALSNTLPPWNDLGTRKAIQSAFDATLTTRRLVGETLDPAVGLVPPVLLDSPVLPASGADLPSLDETSLPVYSADIEPVVQLAAAAATLGLNVQPIQVEWTAFLDGLAEHRFPAYAIYWGADYPSPDAFLRMLFHSESANNPIEFIDQEFDRMVDEGDFTSAQQRLIDLAAVIPVYHGVEYTAIRRGILGTPVSPMGLLGLESVEISS